ncbi:hypothetical protein, partial [Streptomyces sp. 3N207]|uniref:hypothetical protein n=1 Tax=Streptomyces sp. 3N207 TaxID=3457417 RepID=UPI003FCFB17F
GQWREDRAEKITDAARETLKLWPDGLLDYAELAEDIAAEAQLRRSRPRPDHGFRAGPGRHHGSGHPRTPG